EAVAIIRRVVDVHENDERAELAEALCEPRGVGDDIRRRIRHAVARDDAALEVDDDEGGGGEIDVHAGVSSVVSFLHTRMPVILVVDDSELNRQIAVERLAERGFVVAEAGDGAEALREIEARQFDLVLLDVMMPAL